MSSTNVTTVRTVSAKNGYIGPATVDQRTALNELPIAECIYARLNLTGAQVNRATFGQVMDAMRDSNAVVVYYVGGDGKQDARVLWPDSVTLTKENNIVTRAYCTLRREWRTFRVDRMATCHPLSTPDDVLEEDEPQEGSSDWEESYGAWEALSA